MHERTPRDPDCDPFLDPEQSWLARTPLLMLCSARGSEALESLLTYPESDAEPQARGGNDRGGATARLLWGVEGELLRIPRVRSETSERGTNNVRGELQSRKGSRIAVSRTSVVHALSQNVAVRMACPVIIH